MKATDEELVEAFQRGDTSVFDLLVERWDRKIQGAIYRVMGPSEDARDLCQEAFLKAYRGLGTFKKDARFSSWLYQIALNVCRDRLRRRRGRQLVSFDDMDEASQAASTPSVPTPLQLAEANDLSFRVARAVAELPPDQREVIVLKEYQDLTFAEIADVLDLPLSTVKTRLYRGLVQLRERLEHEGIRSASAVPASLP
jgi:RNA polymerase sigma-70 factor, ECF subfamily